MNNFSSHGRGYYVDQYHVVHQSDAKPFKYDENYVATYDTPEYQRGNDILQALRIGFMIASHGRMPRSVCDVGYGNGAFLKALKPLPLVRFGKDVTGKEIDGIKIFDDYYEAEVYTFHDALEHIDDLTFLSTLPAKTVIISLPWCHYMTEGQAWFDNKYKHRKPDEHLHHFNDISLNYFMQDKGYKMAAVSNHEDIVRRSEHGLKNILTMAFKRR